MGVHKEVRKLFGSSVLNYIIAARSAKGFEDAKTVTAEERQDIIRRWTIHKAEYQSSKQKMMDKGGPEGQEKGCLTPKGFLQTRHLSFEERKKLQKERQAKRRDELRDGQLVRHSRTNTISSMSTMSSTGTSQENIREHMPRASQEDLQQVRQELPAIAPQVTGTRAEFEDAIHASVAATSRGIPEEDEMIERAIRASVRELQSGESFALSDQEALDRAIQASITEAARRPSDAGSGSIEFTEQDAEQEALLEQAIQRSLMEHQTQPHDSDDDEDLKLALERSETDQHFTPEPEEIDDALNLAIQQSKEELLKEKTEEQIVLEYAMRQSLREAEHRAAVEGKRPANVVVEKEKPTTADDEAFELAMKESLKPQTAPRPGPGSGSGSGFGSGSGPTPGPVSGPEHEPGSESGSEAAPAPAS